MKRLHIEGGQIRGALFNFFFVVKSALFCIFRMLPSIPTISFVLNNLPYSV